MGCTATRPMPVACAAERQGLAEVALDRSGSEQDFHEDYMLSPKLGRGKFSQVRGVTRRSDTKPWDLEHDDATTRSEAVKIVNLRENSDEPHSRLLQSIANEEIRIWRALGEHPNCLRMHSSFSGTFFCYMVMEKCEMSLLHALDKMPDYTERGLGNVTVQMLRGVAHIHSVSVIHRDIKPDNFLVGGQDGHTVKLIDFGLSVMVPKLGKVSGVFGTAPYMCPEMINGEYYDTKADVWSLGVMVYVLLLGTFPYDCKEPSSSAMKQAIVKGVPPSFLPLLTFDDSRNGYLRTKHAVQLVKALLDRNPMSRVSAKEALRQPWMTLSLNGQHRPGADLPSLRPMLNSAKLAGAFEFRDVSNTSSDDALLDEMQEERDPNSPKFKPKDASKEEGFFFRSLNPSTRMFKESKEEGWDSISSLSTSCDEDCNYIAGAEQVGISNKPWLKYMYEARTGRRVSVTSI